MCPIHSSLRKKQTFDDTPDISARNTGKSLTRKRKKDIQDINNCFSLYPFSIEDWHKRKYPPPKVGH
jgi:hypothetical protein